MRTRWSVALTGVVVGLFAVSVGHAAAQDKEVTLEGKVQIGIHKMKLEAGKLYQFEVKAKGFNPSVNLMGDFGAFMANTADFFKERNTFRGVFGPKKTIDYTLVITPNVFGGDVPQGVLDYTVKMKTIELVEKPLLEKEDKVTADDPKYKGPFRMTHFKEYSIKVKKGKFYVIEMIRTNPLKETLDPYLYLENPNKIVVAQDDDGAGNLNARIMYNATQDGEFRIIATGLNDMRDTGAYKLTVRVTKE